MIVLRYLLEYTPGEIAELLELPRGTVNSRLRRGLDALKERLSEATERSARAEAGSAAWEVVRARLRGREPVAWPRAARAAAGSPAAVVGGVVPRRR